MTNPPARKPGQRWSDFDQWLTGEMLKGKRVTLTIEGHAVAETHPRPGESVQAPVLYFRETPKGLILSNINRHKLGQLFGDDRDACIGQRIMLEAQPVRVANRDQLPIRIVGAAAAAPDAGAKEKE